MRYTLAPKIIENRHMVSVRNIKIISNGVDVPAFQSFFNLYVFFGIEFCVNSGSALQRTQFNFATFKPAY